LVGWISSPHAADGNDKCAIIKHRPARAEEMCIKDVVAAAADHVETCFMLI